MNIFEILTSPQGVTTEMLRPDYWLARSADDVDAPLQSPDDILKFNRRVHQILEIPTLFDLPDSLSSADVESLIREAPIPKQPHFDGSGQAIDAATYDRMLENATATLSAQNAVRYGLVTRRASVRRFPTDSLVMDEPYAHNQDWFQETIVDIGWGVAILTNSGDGAWYFCLTPLYWGWVPTDAVMLISRDLAQDYLNAPQYVVTHSPQGMIAFKDRGGLSPQTGSRFPLLDETDDLWVVQVPTGDPDAPLTEGYIRKDETPLSVFGMGDLPQTPRNLLDIAFGVLGERYAWGGARVGGIFGRDCSRYVKDVFATTGLVMARNGDEQEATGKVLVQFTDEMSDAERKAAIIEHGRIGDILFTRGHVMLYIGHQNGEPYIIHDVGGAYQAVVVSTLVMNENDTNQSILRRLTSLTRMTI